MGYFTNPLKTEDIMRACTNRMYQASPQGEGPRNEVIVAKDINCNGLGMVVSPDGHMLSFLC